MNRFSPAVIPALVLFVSCAAGPARQIPAPAGTSGPAEAPSPFVVADYKNKAQGGIVPDWVSRWLEGGAREVEAMDAYQGSYVFIGRNEGSNFNALNQWNEGFSPELDFPRLAAARIEARFSSGVAFPDIEYGSFFETLIRAASDAPWTGAVRKDDFWIRRKIFSETTEGGFPSQAKESWEFLILVTIEKELFASQLSAVFQSITPAPRPTREQNAAAARVKDRFYEGF